MAIIRAGNEVDAFSRILGNLIPSSLSQVALAGINRSGIRLHGAPETNFGEHILSNPLRGGWFRIRMYMSNTIGITLLPFLRILDENDTPILWFIMNGTSTDEVSYVRSVGHPTGTAHSLGTFSGNVRDVDINWYLHPTEGFLRVYLNEGLVYEFIGNTLGSLSERIAKIQVRSIGSSVNHYLYVSQMILSTTPTFGGRVYTLPIVAEGDYTAWVGDAANISGDSYNPMVGISATTNNQTETFEFADLAALPAGVEVNAVIVSTMARYAENAEVTHQAGVILFDGGLYEYPPVLVGTPSVTGAQHVLERTPTGADWTVAAVNASEFGIRAKVIL